MAGNGRDLMSDHHLIKFTALLALPKLAAQYNYKKAKWDPFFADSEIPVVYPEYVDRDWVEQESEAIVTSLQKALDNNCPKTRPSGNSKEVKFWSNDLTELKRGAYRPIVFFWPQRTMSHGTLTLRPDGNLRAR